MNDLQNAYAEYVRICGQAADLNGASAVLSWDQETYMPPKGFALRGRQLATLAAIAHETMISPRYEELVAQLYAGREHLDDSQLANVLRSKEDLDKARRQTADFVERITAQSSICMEAWLAARKVQDFSIYVPALQTMIDLKREQAALYPEFTHAYDAFLDDYEAGATVALLDPIFKDLQAALKPVLEAIAAAPQVEDSLFRQHFNSEDQFRFTQEVLRKIGYDFDGGRQDYAAHPFSISFGPGDSRITTRVDPEDLSFILWSSIHEGGHALYEQGLPADQYGLPLGAAASLSIHESQSRLWENGVGRGSAFWESMYPKLQSAFPQQLEKYTSEDWFRAASKVRPSLIRTEADELTYHLHVAIRYELEKRIFAGELEAADLEDAWNNAYQEKLGIVPQNATEGVLQDVHWAHGSFGYFPTYTLGSLYAAQFLSQAEKDIEDLQVQLSAGKTELLLAWLRENIHQWGRRYLSEELCRKVCGTGLDAQPFFRLCPPEICRHL